MLLGKNDILDDDMKDVVCGMEVQGNGKLKSTRNGKAYYFCGDACKAKFEKNPGQYAR